MRRLYRSLFWTARALGRPFGGIPPRRLYHWLAEHGFDEDAFRWERNRWGHELRLSPYYLIDRSILAFGCYDPSLHSYLEHHLRPGMVCIDAGANLGEVSLHMASCVGPGGRVYAFEPVPHIHERLASHVKRNGLENVVIVREEALSDRVGAVKVHMSPPDGRNQGMASLVGVDRPSLPQTCEIRTFTLDEFLAEIQPAQIDVIKIDVQGSELRLLRGGRKALERHAPDLLLEVSALELAYEGLNSRDLLGEVESLGYRIYQLKHGRPGARLEAGDIAEDFEASNVLCTKRG